MADWKEYTEPLEILTAEDINNIYNNMQIIKDLLTSKGYSIEELFSVSASFNTQFMDMFDILQNTEYNLDILNNNECSSAYYGSPVKIGDYAPNKEDIWRWIKTLNDMYNIVSGLEPKWQVIRCLDGYPTIDEKKIIARGDYVA